MGLAMSDRTSDELCRHAAELTDAGLAERAIVTALIAAAQHHHELLDAAKRADSDQAGRLLAKAAAMWTTRARRDARRQMPRN